MKIYSWNMLFKNVQLDRALAFIEDCDFDIFCLQEVPQQFFDRLSARFPHVAAVVETRRAFAGEVGTHYLVTLSRHPVRRSAPLPIDTEIQDAPARTPYFSRLMFLLRLWGEGYGPRNNLLTEVITPELGAVHVYNLHLPLKHPSLRKEEFEAALVDRDHSKPTIVCGDFNILESPHISILNWFLGGHFTDALFYTRERRHIEEHFASHELMNPFRGKSTHPLSRSQLDHILVSKSFRVKNAIVSSDRYGSDHAPISVELT